MVKRLQLALALALLVVSAFSFDRYTREFTAHEGGGALISILVANRELAYGTPLRREFLSTRLVPTAYVDARNLRADDVQQVVGVALSTSVRAGQMLLQNDLNIYALSRRALSANIPAGYRALSMRANNLRSFGGLIRPGDRVDIAIQSDDEEDPQERMLLFNIAVLSMGEETERSSTNERPKVVTNVMLMATPQQSGLLAHAARGYNLHFFLRNPADGVMQPGTVVRPSNLRNASERLRFQTETRLALAPEPQPS